MKRLLQQSRRSFQLRSGSRVFRFGRHNGAGSSVYIPALLLLVSSAFSDYRFPIGEEAVYKVEWGLFSCGTITISCDEMPTNGLIRIRVRAQSNWLVSKLYPVDDTVDCFIDPETRLSLRLEKSTSEGGFVCKDVLEFDRTNNVAFWNSESAGITTNYPVNPGTCDAVSFLYAFRLHEFTDNQSLDFDLAVDSVLHGVTITSKGTDRKTIGEEGKLLCRKFYATPKRDDFFVRKIPEEIWITEDERKIMAKMTVRIPVGKVRIELAEYFPPQL